MTLQGFFYFPLALDRSAQAAMAAQVLAALEAAPLYSPVTPGGKPFSVRMSNLGRSCSGVEADPDACLVNFYGPQARMGLHQDQDEADFGFPVVSISLGDTAVFRIGPAQGGATSTLKLMSGDVCVLSGPARLARHGIDRVLGGSSTLLPGGGRLNLTLRRARPAQAHPTAL
jgi:alkylated DNA repair protein (DNA oxidative demethylase)